MTKVQISPELQIETEQFLNGLAQLDASEIQTFSGQVDAILHEKNGDTLSQEEKEHITNANLELPEELHQHRSHLVDKQHEQTLNAVDEVTLQAIDERIQDSNATRLKHLRFLSRVRDIPYEAARELLRKWKNEDPQEQKETLEYLMVALDENRLSDRKLFP